MSQSPRNVKKSQTTANKAASAIDELIKRGEIPGLPSAGGALAKSTRDSSHPDDDVPSVGTEKERVLSDGSGVPEKRSVITQEDVRRAIGILNDYREKKRVYDDRVRSNFEWYRARHWKEVDKPGYEDAPASAYLFNLVENKHADGMDNIPTVTVLPREESDREAAAMLSQILPTLLDYSRYEKVYSELLYDFIIGGTAVHRVVWDSSLSGGVGDVSVTRADILTLFYENHIGDIQKSRHFFSVEMYDNELLVEKYPELDGRIGAEVVSVMRRENDSFDDKKSKSQVVDWYYKKNVGGRTVVHLVKFCGEVLLWASENEPRYAERGIYDSGKYPFVFTPLYPVADSPCGFGVIDVLKDAQLEIDALNMAIVKNAKMSAIGRWFVKEGALDDEAISDFADWKKELIKLKGSGDLRESLIEVKAPTMPSSCFTALADKKEELKETGGNRDVSNGGVTGGVTTASGIAALQEASNKLSRDSTRRFYVGFEDAVTLMLELIRQEYDDIRCFRVAGGGEEQFVRFDNRMIRRQNEGTLDERIPVFDLKVRAMRSSPFSRLSQNELAMELLAKGFFNPELAAQALIALDMMDFEGKDAIVRRVQEGQTLQAVIRQQQQQLAALTDIVQNMTGRRELDGSAPEVPRAPTAKGGEDVRGKFSENEENPRMRAARASARAEI